MLSLVLWLTWFVVPKHIIVRLSRSTFFNSLLNRSSRSENFGTKFRMFRIAPRTDFIFVFSGGFSISIAFTFSLIPVSSISCHSHFVWFIKDSDVFCLLGSRRFPVCLRRQIIFSRGPVCFLESVQLYHLTRPVCCIQVFGQFFLGILRVYWHFGKSVEPFFEWVNSAKFSPG